MWQHLRRYLQCCGGHLWCHRCHNIWLLECRSNVSFTLFDILFGFRFDLFLPLERCEDCGSISKPFFFIVICKHLFSYGSDFIYLARTSPPPPISKGRATSIRCRTGLVDFYFNVKQQRISCVRLHASSKDKLEQSLCTQPAWITSA